MKMLFGWIIALFYEFFLLRLTPADAPTGAALSRGWTERANLLSGAQIAGSQLIVSKEFNLGEGWLTMYMRFNEALTVGTGTTPTAEGELLYIKNVLLKTDRGEILVNLPGRAIYKIAAYQLGSPPRKDAIAAATATYRVTLPIQFFDHQTRRPEDTILDTSRYQSVTLQVTVGTTADLLGTPGTSTVATTLDLEVERTLGPLPPQLLPVYHMNYDFRPPQDAASGTTIELEKSADMSIKRLYVHSGTGTSAGVPFSGANADTIQSTATVKDQNRFIEKERIHAMIQDVNKMQASLETALAGYEIFDFVRDGSVLSAVSTGAKSLLQYTWVNQGGVAANSNVTVAAEQVRSLK